MVRTPLIPASVDQMLMTASNVSDMVFRRITILGSSLARRIFSSEASDSESRSPRITRPSVVRVNPFATPDSVSSSIMMIA